MVMVQLWRLEQLRSQQTLCRVTTLHCTALHYTALHCTTLHCTALHCTALHYTALHCTTLHYTALHCTAMHCTALHISPLPYYLMHVLISFYFVFHKNNLYMIILYFYEKYARHKIKPGIIQGMEHSVLMNTQPTETQQNHFKKIKYLCLSLACTVRCLNISETTSVKTEKLKLKLDEFLEFIPDEPKMANYVTAAGINSILGQLSHLRAQGI